MYREQLGQRNCNELQKAKIVQEMYDAQKMTQGTNNQYVQAKSETEEKIQFHKKQSHAPVARKLIAEMSGVGEGYVQSAVEFGHGLDAADAASIGCRVDVPETAWAEKLLKRAKDISYW